MAPVNASNREIETQCNNHSSFNVKFSPVPNHMYSSCRMIPNSDVEKSEQMNLAVMRVLNTCSCRCYCAVQDNLAKLQSQLIRCTQCCHILQTLITAQIVEIGALTSGFC